LKKEIQNSPKTLINNVVQSDTKLRQKAEEQLKQSEEQYRLLAENVNDIIWTIDLEGYFTYVSPSVEKMRGFTVAEVNHQLMYDSLTPESAAFAKSEFIKTIDALQEGRPLPESRFELEQPCKDGSTIWTESTISVIFDASGNATGFLGVTRDISDRKLAEEIIRENEERLKMALQISGSGCFDWNLKTNESIWSDELKKLHGLRPSETFDSLEHFLSCIFSEDRPYVMAEMQRVIQQGGSALNRYRICRIDNSEVRWLEARVQMFCDTATQPAKIIGVVTDITENKLAEDLLKAREERFRQLIKNSFDMIVLMDASGIQQFVSDSCEKILGYRPDELINIPVIEQMIHPEDKERLMLELQNALIRGYGGVQYRHRHKNGDWVYLEAFGINQLNNPPINSIVLNVRDITERKKAEQALRESEEKFQIILNASSDPIFTFYPDGEYRYVNKAFANGVGKKPEEIIGRKIWDVFSRDEADKRFSAVKWVFENGEAKVIEVCVTRPDGDHWYITTVQPILNEQDKVISVICISKEITERKNAEEALKKSEARLRDLNATKDKFFSIIAHDLRSPFNSIVGFSELLTQQVQENDYEGIEKYAKIIQNSSKRAMSLITNLLDWARSQTGRMEFNPETFEIVALIKEVKRQLINSAQQKSITISKKLPHDAPVLADKAMIGTVLRNLLSNAIKYTQTGGKIVISSEQKPDELLVTVSDNGVGISSGAIPMLFRIDTSYSTMGTQNEKGTGLGLILCNDFILKHGGKIWVESVLGEGSKFHFTIPNDSTKKAPSL
jgi:PAS domain S-box-containing protein